MNKPELTFVLGCIPLRSLLALQARRDPQSMTLPAMAVAAGMAYMYVTKGRMNPPETGGRPMWWQNLRPIHALLWAAFAVAALQGKPWAWKFLAADVILGMVAFFFVK